MSAKVYATENAAFLSAVTGVPANHSSTAKSVADCDHAQSDDQLQNVQPHQDPNISGAPEMTALHDPMAGTLDWYQQNDDYKYNFRTYAGRFAEDSDEDRQDLERRSFSDGNVINERI